MTSMGKHDPNYVFGMDKEIQEKLMAKMDAYEEKQAVAQAWIQSLTGEEFTGKNFHESLMDGVLLCKTLNAIKPKTVKKIGDSKMPFKQRENIVNYLEGCLKLGMKSTDNFVTTDLFEGDNIPVVIDQIFCLGGLSRSIEGFDGPYIGSAFAKENIREFSEEVLAEGRKIVPAVNAGSIAIEKSKGTDAIVMYGKVGQEMGAASSAVSQVNAGSIAVEKSKGTDAIVMYGKVGQEMGKASTVQSQQTAGSIAVEKEIGTDAIVMYGKAGQELGQASNEVSQQNAGSLHVEKQGAIDNITRVVGSTQK